MSIDADLCGELARVTGERDQARSVLEHLSGLVPRLREERDATRATLSSLLAAIDACGIEVHGGEHFGPDGDEEYWFAEGTVAAASDEAEMLAAAIRAARTLVGE